VGFTLRSLADLPRRCARGVAAAAAKRYNGRMKRTPLYDWHLARGACMVEFAGWEMPVYYPTGAVKEHELTRASAGLFDIDHMGQLVVSGPGAGIWLSSQISRLVTDMAQGEARYALLLNPEGGVIDDLFIYRLDAASWFVVVNAGNRQTDVEWLSARLPADGSVSLKDVSDEYAMLAVQGPRAIELLERCGWTEDGALSAKEHHGQSSFAAIGRATIARAVLFGTPCRVGRTGYTGEDGVEVFCPAPRYLAIWEGLLAAAEGAGISAGPIGLAARDSLRFEAGMPLHGHEISPTINPVEALLSWGCDFQHDYPGRAAVEALKTAGPQRKLVTISVKGGVPREGAVITAWPDSGDPAARQVLGTAVCGMFCPSAKAYACNAFVPAALASPGTPVGVVIRDQVKEAVIVKRPLYLPVYRR
jgi:glycine cleavage system T protein